MTPPGRPRRHACRGITLIELMVSLVLGLLLMVAVVNAYLSSARAAQVAEAQARMHDDASAALTLLKAHIRMAGNNPERPFRDAASARNPVYSGPGAIAFALRGCENGFANAATAPRIDDLACATTSGASAAFAVTYEADVYNTASVGGGAVPLDCAGFPWSPLTATVKTYDAVSNAAGSTDVEYFINESRFYVDVDAGIPRLMCRGGGAGFQPSVLVENVEEFRVTYGLISPSADAGPVAGYLTASGMASEAQLAVLTEPQRWAKVSAVSLCMVLRSPLPVVHDAASARYVDCSGTLVHAPDLRLRHAFRATIAVRGRT